jgi:phosphopantetheine adenylyltransferase
MDKELQYQLLQSFSSIETRIQAMALQLQSLQTNVAEAVTKLDAPAVTGFTQAQMDAAVAAAEATMTATQAQTDAANQAIIDGLTADLATATAPATPVAGA